MTNTEIIDLFTAIDLMQEKLADSMALEEKVVLAMQIAVNKDDKLTFLNSYTIDQRLNLALNMLNNLLNEEDREILKANIEGIEVVNKVLQTGDSIHLKSLLESLGGDSFKNLLLLSKWREATKDLK